VVSVDSRQIYRRLEAGTAKPTGTWDAGPDGTKTYLVEGIPYHLVDLLDPREGLDAARYAKLAREAIEDVQARGRRPILAGGSGMYLQAIFNGLDPLPPRSTEVRRRLEEELAWKGPAALGARLAELDPDGARWAGSNPRRLVRGLEVIEASGRPLSSLWTGRFLRDLPYDQASFVGLEWDAGELDRRIGTRARAIWPALVRECAGLLEEGFRPEDPGLRTLGYPEGVAAATGSTPEGEALDRLIRLTRRFAKRQRTWLRRYRSVRWERPAPGLAGRLASEHLRWSG